MPAPVAFDATRPASIRWKGGYLIGEVELGLVPIFAQLVNTTVVDRRLAEVSLVSGSGSAVHGIDGVFAIRTKAAGAQRRAIRARAAE